MLAAAREAVPQLVIPTWADQWENADAIVRSGSGILLEEHERDTGTILEAVQRLMHDESLRAAARRVATEISEMPSPSDHVTALERLALDRGRRSGL